MAAHPFLRELQLTLKILSRNPSAVMGGVVIAAMVLLAVGAPLLAPHDPVKLSLGERLMAPGAAHLFGTDELGRDIFSRVLFGARISLSIGLLVITVAGVTGALIGATSGYFGGKIDNVIMRLMDVILSFPSLILALALAAAMGPSLVNAILATAFVMIPKFARLVRGEALVVRELPFVA
ncbi:MAG TPA: D,D-dipeptide ABC transporter permease, partial [Desulfomicrobium sp.]|nr:D,D-dipeptide ABC transporter permease [Desulfomicrobium sp.]